MAAALRRQAPDFVDRLRQKGVRYLYRYGAEDIVSTTGASVLSAYGRDVRPGDDAETARRKIERQVRRHSDDFEWHDDGSLSVTHVVPSEWLGSLLSQHDLVLVHTDSFLLGIF